jgi:putative ABC transport system permease protein
MDRWWLLSIRNWRTRPGRALTTVASIAIGVTMVAAVTCCYASVAEALNSWVIAWLGKSEIRFQNKITVNLTVSENNVEKIRSHPKVKDVAVRLRGFLQISGKGSGKPSQRLIGFVDGFGISPPDEYVMRPVAAPPAEDGRLLAPDDHGGIMVSHDVAAANGYLRGDKIFVGVGKRRRTVEVVGIVERAKVGAFQKGAAWLTLSTMQDILSKPGQVSEIDATLENVAAIDPVREELKQLVDANVMVSSSKQKADQFRDGIRMFDLILELVSMIALLAAAFIIFSTLNMSVVERTRELGILRCVGMNRIQTAALVFGESMPLGALGVAIGIPLGLVVASQGVKIFQQYFGEFTIDPSGLILAGVGGLAATALATLIPAVNASRVSPLEATRPMAKTVRFRWTLLAAALGAGFIGLQLLLLRTIEDPFVNFIVFVFGGVPLLIAGYALLAPFIIGAVVRLLVFPIGFVLRLRARLLMDQFGQAHWRNGAICAAMMVGIGLVVTLRTNTTSILARWDFPSKFPDACLWSWSPLDEDLIETARGTPGIDSLSPVSFIPLNMKGVGGSTIWKAFASTPTTRFLALEPWDVPAMIKLEYRGATEQEALKALDESNGVLVTEEFHRTYGKGVGDKIQLRLSEFDPWSEFHIAAVVRSPGIEVAVDWFDQRQMFEKKAIGAVLGSRRQTREHFHEDRASMLMFNFQYPKDSKGGSRDKFERQVFANLMQRVNRTAQGVAYPVRATRLKELMTRDVMKATAWLLGAAGVTIVVAGLGAANVMAANIVARRRQIAVLRAVGATRWQITRLVFGESVVLACVGSMMGIILGLHLAWLTHLLIQAMVGLSPVWTVPWIWLLFAAAFAVVVCLAAAIIPSYRASRSSIVAAMQA